MPPPLDIRSALRDALAVLRCSGWNQYDAQMNPGPVYAGPDGADVVQAIAFATLHDPAGRDRFADTCDAFRAVAGPLLGRWNDKPGRTLAEVEAAFAAAMERA